MHRDAHGGVFVWRQTLDAVAPHDDVTHAEHRLCFVRSGSVQLLANGPVHANAGSLVVLPAGVPHRSLGGKGDLWLAGFCAGCLGLDERQRLMAVFRRIRHGGTPVVSIEPDRRDHVDALFSALSDEAARSQPESLELCRCWVTLLLGEVHRARRADVPGVPAGSLVAGALDFIHRRALHPISLRDVASAVHRSPAHVATSVKRATGHTVGDWIRSVRVAEAAARLAHSDESLDVIAERVGWQDKTHFIRQFRKEYGQTPAAWRREQRRRHATDR